MPGSPFCYKFGVATTDYGVCTNAALLSASAWTVLTWVYPVATTAGRWIVSKNTNTNARARILRLDGADGTKLSGFISQVAAPQSREVISVTGTIKAGVWQLLGETYDDAGDRQIHLFTGTHSSPLTEVTYGSTLAVTDVLLAANGNFNIANRIGGTDVLSFPGYIGPMAVIEGRALSLGEMRVVQNNFEEALLYHPTLFTYLGKVGPGRFVDESGSNNHGTLGGGLLGNLYLPRVRPFKVA